MAFAMNWGGRSRSSCFWCSDPSDNHYDHKEDKDRTSVYDGDNKGLRCFSCSCSRCSDTTELGAHSSTLNCRQCKVTILMVIM